MYLQDEFRKYGYDDLLIDNKACDYNIKLDGIFDGDKKPKELLSIYRSKQGDELFFLLDDDGMEINHLCDDWDTRIRVFTLLNDGSEEVEKLKYNIVQLIITSKEKLDRREEGNLLISRKIIINGDKSNKEKIKITESDAIELPFYMIPPDTVEDNKEKKDLLDELIPSDEKLLMLLKKKNINDYKDGNTGVNIFFEPQDYESIKRWLEEWLFEK